VNGILTPDLVEQIYVYQTLGFYLMLLAAVGCYVSTKEKIRKVTSPTFFIAVSRYAFRFFLNFAKSWLLASLAIVLLFFVLFSVQVGYKVLVEFF